jgi:hypothetical protein
VYIFKLLFGLGKEEQDFKITPVNIIITATGVGLLFLGSIALLLLITSYING